MVYMYIFFKILKSLRNLGGVEGVSRTSILLLKRGYIILPSFFKAWEGAPCYSRCFLRLKHTMEKNHNAEFNSTHRERERERGRERERERERERLTNKQRQRETDRKTEKEKGTD